jgi:hypothetical protein
LAADKFLFLEVVQAGFVVLTAVFYFFSELIFDLFFDVSSFDLFEELFVLPALLAHLFLFLSPQGLLPFEFFLELLFPFQVFPFYFFQFPEFFFFVEFDLQL